MGVVNLLLRSGLEERQLARLVGRAGPQEVEIAARERQRAVGGAQERERGEAAVRCRRRRGRYQVGTRLRLGHLLRRGLQLQPEEHRTLAGLTGETGGAQGFLGPLGVIEAIADRHLQLGHTGGTSKPGGCFPVSAFLSDLTPS